MSIDLETICELEAIRHGHPPPATQTENDLAELCQMKSEELEKCQQEHNKLLMELREIISIIEGECPPVFRTPRNPHYTAREEAALARAKKALKEAK